MTSPKRLAWVLGLAATYMIADLVGGLVANSLALLADAGHVNEVRDVVRSVEGVSSVHDLHVWSITSGVAALSAQVCADARSPASSITEIQDVLHKRFGIDHVTLQDEPHDLTEAPRHA